MQLFGRAWRVTIDNVQLEQLAVKFNVTKTLKPEPNKLELSVYNLAESTRHRLKKSDSYVVLEAGYAGSMGVVFSGDARRISDYREGPDWILRVEAGDAEKAIRTKRVSKSFAPGVNVGDVLGELAKSLGIPADRALARLKKSDYKGGLNQFANGFAFAGPAYPELARQLRHVGLTPSVQDGELQILATNETTQHAALVVGPDTGLIGSPQVKEDKTLAFKTLLQTSLAPGRRVVLDSASIKGTYRIESITYNGDSNGNEWSCDCEGKEI